MIVLLAHGSPDPRHGRDVVDLAARVGSVLDTQIEVAYLDHQPPALTDIAERVDPGDTVAVLPLLLASGLHARVDVPALLADARQARGDVDWRQVPTLPPQSLALAVGEALTKMLPVTAAGRQAPPTTRAVVGVAAGSSRSGALDSFEELASSLRPTGVELVVANGPAAVPSAAELAAALTDDGDVTVVPLMFADGVLVDRTRDMASRRGWAVTHPVGRTAAAAEALASWLLACRVSRATLAANRGARTLVYAAP